MTVLSRASKATTLIRVPFVSFIRIQSYSATDSAGVPLIAFSSRFTLQRMTGRNFAEVPLPAGAGANASPVNSAAPSATPSAASASYSAIVTEDRLQLVPSSSAFSSAVSGSTVAASSSSSASASASAPAAATRNDTSSAVHTLAKAGASLLVGTAVMVAFA